MLHRIEARIDRSALQHNFSVARTLASTSPVTSGTRVGINPDKTPDKIVAMIKANAYGHGLLQVAEALQEADVFGVSDVEEAEQLHLSGCITPILILQGLVSPQEDAALIISRGYQCVVHRLDDVMVFDALCRTNPPPAPLTMWLKLDSGMGRLGLPPDDCIACYHNMKQLPWVKDIVLMTHLASSSEPQAPLNQTQLAGFAATRQTLQHPYSATSISASAGLLALNIHSGFVRPGIMLYGSSPFPYAEQIRRREAFDLRSVMTLQAKLISIREHQRGDSIGYNSQFVCPGPMRIGIVSCGYADGYPSNTPNGCPVLVDGRRCHTVGRVSMDMLAIDLSPCPTAQVGMPVTLWGETLSVDEIAAHTGILSYNLTCSVAARVPRHYV